MNGDANSGTGGQGGQVGRVGEIQRMKAELQAHYERFKALRAEGRGEEAVAQFNVTLKAAGDLLETSTRVLKDLAMKGALDADAASAAAEANPSAAKVLHLPKKPRTH